MMSRIIGAGVAAALSLQTASAAVVVYDNSAGTFGWEIGKTAFGETPIPGTYLDITQPPTQSGEKRPGTISKWYYLNSSSSSPAVRYFDAEPSVEISKTIDPVYIPWQDHGFYLRVTKDYKPTEFVEPVDNWDDQSDYFFHLPFSSDLKTGSPAIGKDAYIGLRVKMADNQWHYGWIHFVDYKTPVAWAYETEPNVLIQIPVPGPATAVIAVAVGGMLSATRTRR